MHLKKRLFMKYFVSILLCVFTINIALGQGASKRLVVIEEFTSATCGPCVDADKVLKTVVNIDSGIIALKYHLNVPSPGDPFYKANPAHNDKRGSLYSIPALPAARVNGYRNVDPRDGAAMIAASKNDQSIPYPIAMKVTNTSVSGNEMKAIIEIESDIEINNFVLHAAVYAEDVKLPDLPKTLANSNGQSEFSSALLLLLPNENGTVWNSTAKEKKSVEFIYTKGTSEVWQGNSHIIAFLQNPSTLEIVQAAISLPKQPGTMVSTGITYPPTIAPTFSVIDPDQSVEVKAVISNLSASTINYTNLQIVKSARTPIDWILSVNGASPSFTLLAGQTKEFTVKLQRTATTGIGEAVLTFGEAGNSKTYISTPITIVSKESEAFLIQDNNSGSSAPFEQAISKVGVKKFIPLSTKEFIQNITRFTSLKRVLWHCADSGKIDRSESDFILGLMNRGVSFLISGHLLTNNMFFDGVSLLDTIGVSYAGFQLKNTDYTFTGINADTITDGFKEACIKRNYALFPMKFNTKAAFGTLPLLRYGNGPADTLVGVRTQKMRNRIVYFGFNPLVIQNEISRNALINKSLTWIENFTYTPQASVKASATSLAFGTLTTVDTKTNSLSVKNIGDASCTIESSEISGNDKSDFSVISKKISLNAGDSAIISVDFAPKIAGDKTAVLTITLNKGLNPIVVSLSGSFIPSSIHEMYEQLGIKLSVIGNSIEITNQYQHKYKVVLTDIHGNAIHTLDCPQGNFLINNIVNGFYVVSIMNSDTIYSIPLIITY